MDTLKVRSHHTYAVQTIDSLGITYRKGIKMILSEGHNQACHT